jgi:hypothetical protein
MHSQLVLRSPNGGVGWADNWAFTGRDERLLRDLLDQLDAYVTPAPVETPDGIEPEHRWTAAMLLFDEETYRARWDGPRKTWQAERAWTSAGALRLAELLPDGLSDVRSAIEDRFAREPT